MQILSFSEKGNRPENEDFVFTATLDATTSIHIVADGMGGYEHGALAAKTVTNTIVDSIKKNICIGVDIESIIQNAINVSNIAVQKLRTEYNSKIGSTVAGIVIVNNQAYCFWLGDVRIYQIRDKNILFQSKDHSLINELSKNGQVLTPALIEQYRHIVTRSIQGNGEEMKPDIVVINDLVRDDTLIVCSDGVHNVFGSSKLEHLFQSTINAEYLIKQIKEKCEIESCDNYSLIVIRVC